MQHPHAANAAFAFFVLPEKENSLSQLEQIQSRLGVSKRDIVLLPSEETENRIHDNPFASNLIEPTNDIFTEWGAKSTEELITKAKERGYDGFALDLYHMRSSDTMMFTNQPWEEVLPDLLHSGFVKQIHISAGRGDMDRPIDTIAELKDLFHGTNNTQLPKILKAIGNSEWNGRVVVEIPSDRLSKNKVLRRREFVRIHQQILTNIQSFLS